MRKKPMLCRKLQDRNRHKIVIGLMGAHSGAGVTCTGLMLAFYMGEEQGIRTAFLECSGHDDINLLQQAYEWKREDLNSFTYGHITCFKKVTSDQVADILGEGYGCVIFDFGADFAENRAEFLRCDRKLVLGGWAEWNCQKLGRFIRSVQSIKGNETWDYLVPCAGPKIIRGLHREFSRKFYSVPLERDLTRPSRTAGRLFRMLLD